MWNNICSLQKHILHENKINGAKEKSMLSHNIEYLLSLSYCFVLRKYQTLNKPSPLNKNNNLVR